MEVKIYFNLINNNQESQVKTQLLLPLYFFPTRKSHSPSHQSPIHT
jgi:hypothetical protein